MPQSGRTDLPADAGFSPPPEWAPHRAVWTAWPDHPDWGEALSAAKRELADLVRAIRHEGRGERVRLLVRDEALEAEAAAALAGAEVDLVRGPYGDIWLRDTGPIFLRSKEGEVAPVCFRFNGWGGKFVMAGDERTAAHVADLAAQEVTAQEGFHADLVLEGGAVEFDGEGTLLTTRQCLLEPNRNPQLNEEEIESALLGHLGVEKVLWLQDGLQNDHTDGHIDTLARFVGPGRVMCMRPSGLDDPNREVLETIRRDLEGMTDARGRRLEVMTVPSPGAVLDDGGRLMPASYANFYIANTCVLVPAYGSPHDAAAVEALRPLFPGREVLGLSARAILVGGGAFHCITQQVPLAGAPEEIS